MVSSPPYHHGVSVHQSCEYCVRQYKTQSRQLPGGLGVRIQCFHCCGPGLMSSQETNILHGATKIKHTNPSKWMLCENTAQLSSSLLHFLSPSAHCSKPRVACSILTSENWKTTTTKKPPN